MKDRYRDFMPYLPGFFFILLLLCLGILLWLTHRGQIKGEFVSAVSSFVLVTVTIYYAWQSRKSAHATEDTLDEMTKQREKPGKVLTIAFGIDPTLKDLRDDKRSLERTGSPQILDDFYDDLDRRVPLTNLNGLEEPDWAIRSDIEDVGYGDFSNDIDKYRSLVEDYNTAYWNLKEEMAETLREEVRDELETVTRERGNSVENEATQYIDRTLRFSEQYLKPEELNKKVTKRAAELREATELVEETENSALAILDLNKVIGSELEKVRQDIKKKYSIAEHEIKEASEESVLDDDRIAFYGREPTYTDSTD